MLSCLMESAKLTFRRRLLSTLLLWALVLGTVLSGFEQMFFITIAGIGLLGLWEYYEMLDRRGVPNFKLTALITAVIFMAGSFLTFRSYGPDKSYDFEIAVLVLFLLVVFGRQMFRLTRDHNPLETMAYTLFGLLYVVWLFNFLTKIVYLAPRDSLGETTGQYYVLYLLLVAIVGTGGLRPTFAAIRAGKDIALASKEVMVVAGELIMEAVAQHGVRILPVDSEHNAIFQCLGGDEPATVKRLILTASGGPFRSRSRDQLPQVTPEEALRHPTWQMGEKVTIDSATLFNKGLEMIEARWLFGVEMARIDVVIHPQSIIHSMVEFVDGSVLAQMSHSDMRFPIQYALTWPDRIEGSLPPLNFTELGRLDFEEPRYADFPSLNLARQAGEQGGAGPAVLNAANEVAVAAFLAGEITFPRIWQIVGQVLDQVGHADGANLEDLLTADEMARSLAAQGARS